MSSLSSTYFVSLPRWNSTLAYLGPINCVKVLDVRLKGWRVLSATSRNAIIVSVASSDAGAGVEQGVAVKRKRGRPRKEAIAAQDEYSARPVNGDVVGAAEGASATEKTGRSKQASPQGERVPEKTEEEKIEKGTRRRRKSMVKEDEVKEQGHEVELNNGAGIGQDPSMEAVTPSSSVDEEKIIRTSTRRKNQSKEIKVDNYATELELINGSDGPSSANDDNGGDNDDGISIKFGKDDEDVSFTYSWPPLVCCFGAAQHAFLPSGRPANRLLDYELHRRMKDVLWAPEKFVRAPGGSAGSVAIALANIGGKVVFMGKLGNDDYGQTMLYYLNVNNVQTRSVRIDSRRPTAISQMKIGKRGALRMSTVRPCAEDSLTKSEINIDVLKEARMFYCNTSSLLEQNMRRTTLEAIKISKKLGGVIFFDLNLPLPLWQSNEETKQFIQEVWNLADIVEVTKQELEFLCGITPTEKFDTEDNDKSKFVHYQPDVLAPLFHEHLKVLFVTNGTSKIHYYTKEKNGVVRGMENPPITPFTCDMSAAGDGIVAALMRMLSLQPQLIIDKVYIEQSIKYAISCGVTSQWHLGRQRGFPPKEGLEDEVVPDPDGIISLTERQLRMHSKVPTS